MDKTSEFLMQTAVAGIMQQTAGSGVEVVSIVNWGIGALNDCLKVETNYPKATFFVKIERENIIPRTRQGQIAREVHGIRLAQAAGLPIPTILNYDLTGSQVGRKYLVEAFIDAQLFWELKDQLTAQEREGLQRDMAAVLEKMKTITGPLFGDIFPGGLIGQHPTWKACCRASTDLLLQDCQALDLYSPSELDLINQTLTAQLDQLGFNLSAALYHGDLGMHNVMVDSSAGYARLGTLIDFGNAQFSPLYMNDQDTRLYGGFGLEPIDVEACYGVSPAEQAANRLIGGLDMVVFRAMLKKKFNHDTGPFTEKYLEQCRKAG